MPGVTSLALPAVRVFYVCVRSSSGGWGERPGTGQTSSRKADGERAGARYSQHPPPGRAGQASHAYFASNKKRPGILLC